MKEDASEVVVPAADASGPERWICGSRLNRRLDRRFQIHAGLAALVVTEFVL